MAWSAAIGAARDVHPSVPSPCRACSWSLLFNPGGDPPRRTTAPTPERRAAARRGLALAVPPWRFTTRTGRWAARVIDSPVWSPGAAGVVLPAGERVRSVHLPAGVPPARPPHGGGDRRRGPPRGPARRGLLSSRPLVLDRSSVVRHLPLALAGVRPHPPPSRRGAHRPPTAVLRLAITIGLADLSYRFVEQPVRHGALRRAVQRWRAVEGPKRVVFSRRTLVSTTTAVVLVFGVVVGLAFTPAARHAPPGFEGLPPASPPFRPPPRRPPRPHPHRSPARTSPPSATR